MSNQDYFSLIREVALESARLAASDVKPSRLNCIFAAETMEMARRFRDRYRAGAGIYSIETINPNYRMHRGDFELVTNPINQSFVDGFAAMAVRYWTNPGAGLPEILLDVAVRVISRIE